MEGGKMTAVIYSITDQFGFFPEVLFMVNMFY
jgi:hypothetical protein